MLKLRYWIRLFTTFISRFKFLLFISLIGGLFAFIGFKFLLPTFFKNNGETIGVVGRYHPDNLPTPILSQISSGLTVLNKSGEPTPGIAESWENKEQGKIWIFHLKDNLTWQDNSPLTSDTLSYSFEDVNIETPDNTTIIFTLKEPFSPFPTIVSRPAFKKGLLGTGDWVAKKITLNGGYVETLILKNNLGTKQTYKFFPTEEKAKTAFKLGVINRLEGIISPHPFDKWSTVTIQKTKDLHKFTTIFLNAEDEVFAKDNKKLRQALYYAIDKESFGEKRALSPISPLSWAYNPQVKKYSYDPQRAKELLSSYPEEYINNLDIKLTTTPALLEIAEKVAEFWEKIGVKTTVQVVSILPEEYQAFLAIYNAPQDPDQYSTWHSSQTETNISHLNNPRIDKLLEDGRLELNPKERKKIYLDFQRFLLEEASALFLYHPTTYTIVKK